MLKATINKDANHAVIVAEGNYTEMLNDVAIVISGIYKQMQSSDPLFAAAFRCGLTGMVNDPNSPLWKNLGDQIGFAVKK